jgi:hypothetical protein
MAAHVAARGGVYEDMAIWPPGGAYKGIMAAHMAARGGVWGVVALGAIQRLCTNSV